MYLKSVTFLPHMFTPSVCNCLHVRSMVNVQQVCFNMHLFPGAVKGVDSSPKYEINKRWKVTTSLKEEKCSLA